MRTTPEDVHKPFRERPGRRIAAELYCLALSFWFHPNNNHGRKAATILVVGVWAAIEVGAAFGPADLPNQFSFLRLFVGVLVGRMWGIEINNFAGVEFGYSDSGGEDDE